MQHLVAEHQEFNAVSLLCVVGSAVGERSCDLVSIWVGRKRSPRSQSPVRAWWAAARAWPWDGRFCLCLSCATAHAAVTGPVGAELLCRWPQP